MFPKGSRLQLMFLRSIIYIYYIHPELSCSFRSGKGAGAASKGARREQGRVLREQQGSTMGQCNGVVSGSLKWLPWSRFEPPSLLLCCLDLAISPLAFTEPLKRACVVEGVNPRQ